MNSLDVLNSLESKLENENDPSSEIVKIPLTDLWLYHWDLAHGYNQYKTCEEMLNRILEDNPNHVKIM